MARVSPQDQFVRYELSRDIYVARRSIYSYLNSTEQRTIYAFYQPHKDHLPASLQVHQRAVAKAGPSLPHRAGKAYQTLEDAAYAIAKAEAERPIGPLETGPRKGSRRKRVIVARPLNRLEPNLTYVAHVVIDLAEKMAKEAEDAERAA